jgi:hypothetical protein
LKNFTKFLGTKQGPTLFHGGGGPSTTFSPMISRLLVQQGPKHVAEKEKASESSAPGLSFVDLLENTGSGDWQPCLDR